MANRRRPGDPRQGRRWVEFRRALLPTLGTRCWLCRRVRCAKGCCALANTLDHVRPVVTHPHLAFDPANCRPAHRCCNSARGARPPADPDPLTEDW